MSSDLREKGLPIPSQLPPGPRYPGLVNVYLSMRRTTAFLDAASKKYGDIFTVRLIRGKMIVFVNEPSLVEAVFTADPEVLVPDKGAQVLVGQYSIVGLEGEEHQAARALLMPSFHADHIQRYHGVMERVCAEEFARWPLNEPVELFPRMEEITLGVVMSAVFGMRGGPGLESLRARFADLLAYRDKPIGAIMVNVMPPGSKPPRSFVRVRGGFDTEVFELIEQARHDPKLDERDDILAMLLRARHEDGSPLADQEVRDHLATLLIMGHVSTATTIAWVLERLVRHPEALERLRAEAQTANEDYLDAVLTETMRVRPPVPVIVREVAKPFPLGGYELQPGNLVGCNAYGLHLRDDLYPEPRQFRPERFLEHKPAPYTWIPFGGGARHCIGRSFAMMEMKYVLRSLMQQFRFATTETRGEKQRRRGIGLIPVDGAKVVILERLPAAAKATVAASA